MFVFCIKICFSLHIPELPIKACDAKLMSSSTLSRTSRKQGKTRLLEEQGRIAQTHRYSQGPKEADS